MYHIRMSLYDKYHSQHNKTYMYDLITNLIKENYKVDVSNDDTYKKFYETNFLNSFSVVDTEELSDINKHLLDTQVDYYKQLLSKRPMNKEQVNESENISEQELTHTIIYSLQRIINFQQSNRYSYKIHQQTLVNKKCQIEKVILPIEDNYLFSCPIIIISFDNKHVELHLRGTMKISHREYGIYTPFYETTFSLLTNKIKITLNNQLSNDKKGCDVYKIDSYDNGTIGITCDKGEFMIGDYIRVCNFENIDLDDKSCLYQQYKIIGLNDKGISIESGPIIKERLYIMNISLQHSIHLSYG
jgi:hypothetical protein